MAGLPVGYSYVAPGISHLTKAAESASFGADEDIPPISVAEEEDRRGTMRALRRESKALHHFVRFLPDHQSGAATRTDRHEALA
jgi:hypothetical protein